MTEISNKNSSKTDTRIVFFGTPDFAVPSLKKILEAGYHVAGVVTSPDKPAGRGRKLRPTPVKAFALEHGLKVLQPSDLKDPSFIETLKTLNPTVGVVVAFRKLPAAIWRIPPMGTFNLHASLLPDYRGAAPIQHVLFNGEPYTGVTTFLIDDRIDTGQILLQKKIPVNNRCFGELYEVLKDEGAHLVVDTLRGLENGSLHPVPQNETKALHKAPKIKTEDLQIDWHRPGIEIQRHICGLSPVPGARTTYSKDGINFEPVKILKARFEPARHRFHHGTARVEKDGIAVAVPGGFLWVETLTPGGKRPMSAREFSNGLRVKNLIFK